MTDNQSSIAILLLRDLEADEFEQVACSGGVVHYFGFTPKSDVYDFPLVEVEIDAKIKAQLQQNAFDAVKHFATAGTEGTCYASIYQVETANLWYYHRFRIYFNLRRRFYHQEAVSQIKERHKKCVVYGGESMPSNEKVEHRIGNPKKKKLALKNVFYFGLRALRGLLQTTKFKEHLLLYNVVRQQTILSSKTLQPVREFTQLFYLKEFAEEFYTVHEELPIPELKDGGLNLSKFMKPYSNSSYLGECNVLKGLWHIRKVRTTLASIEKQREQLAAQEKDEHRKQIWEELGKLGSTSFAYLLRYYGYCRFFKKNTFKSVTSVDENSSKNKIVLDAAKKFGIKTIGIQHGIIYGLHPAYTYSKEEKQFFGITPDITLVWGSHWEASLKNNGNYSSSEVSVVGQLRTDIIRKLEQNNQESSFSLLFATQPLKDETLRAQVMRVVREGMKNLEGVNLLVKPHPNEKDILAYCKKHLQGVDYTIVEDGDLYGLISQSNEVLTCFSTVGVESVYFQRPLITIDPYDEDLMNYKKDGLAHQVINEADFVEIVSKIQEGRMNIDVPLIERFIQQYAYKIDGKVCQRIVEETIELTKT